FLFPFVALICNSDVPVRRLPFPNFPFDCPHKFVFVLHDCHFTFPLATEYHGTGSLPASGPGLSLSGCTHTEGRDRSSLPHHAKGKTRAGVLFLLDRGFLLVFTLSVR